MAGFSFGPVFANIANASAKVQFELQFNLLQNTLIRRFNERIDKVEGRIGDKHEIERLLRETVRLSDSLPILQAYRQGNANNNSVLEVIQDAVNTLSTVLDGDNDGNVTAAEVTAYTEQRDLVVEQLTNLYLFIHPDINDGNIILKLKEEIDNLSGQTPVVGLLTDAANVTVTDFTATLSSKVGTAFLVTQNTVTTALDLELKISSDLAFRQTKVIDLTTVQQAQQKQETESLQAELANFLRVISLTFEVNTSFADFITSFLTEKRPEPGSILNLFT